MSPATTDFDCDVLLKDGSTLRLRTGTPDQVPAVMAFIGGLSDRSHYQRFFGGSKLTPANALTLTAPGPGLGVALLGECHGQVVAHAGFYKAHEDSERAEVAFAIADAMQGKGIGTRLLERLADVARQQGIQVFDAYVLGENRRMLEVFADSGFDVRRTLDGGVFHVSLTLDPTDAYVEQAARRAQSAASASLRPFFEPRGVAVVGASRRRGRIGSEILHNLTACGYTGTLAPVHPVAAEIEGLTAYARVTMIPGPVDLAVVAVPAAEVPGVVDDCIAKGVRAICVISAGFGESNADGRALEAAVLAKVRAAGIRMVGPNCMGLLNTDPAVNLNATFSPVYPPAGSVAMSTQSGALGLAILDYARRLNIGISSFVSVGNKADVSGNDLLQYWAEDPRTAVILLYLESFGNPRKFGQIARRVGRAKPIVAVKAGRSRAGARAASSHTGALAASDAVVDALFRQAGVMRTDTFEEMFDVAALLAHQPLPRGPRVAILTNAGGPGILCADACEAKGLVMATIGEQARQALLGFLPAAASVANPVDMLASAPPDHYRRAAAALLADDGVDSLVTIFIPPLVTAPDAVAAAIVEATRQAPAKPVIGVFMRAGAAPDQLAPIPCYQFPESAAIALARVTSYSAWRQRPVGECRTPDDLDAESARSIVGTVLARGGGWLTPPEAQQLMRAVGVDTPASQLVTTPNEAAAAASAIGFPVVLKAVGASLLHKTERQAVMLGLATEEAVRAAAGSLVSRLGDECAGLLVQQMVPGGVEMLVGATLDPQFGPLVVCGSGGILVELVGDTSMRLHPVSTTDAADMVNELKGARLLRGYRGQPPADEQALRDVICRISALLTLCPEIAELDINPLKVLPSGAQAVDVRVRAALEQPRLQSRRIEY